MQRQREEEATRRTRFAEAKRLVAAGASVAQACQRAGLRDRFEYYRLQKRVRKEPVKRGPPTTRSKDPERRRMIRFIAIEGNRTNEEIATVVEALGFKRPDPTYVGRVLRSEGLTQERLAALSVHRAFALYGPPESIPPSTRQNGLGYVGTLEERLEQARTTGKLPYDVFFPAWKLDRYR